MSLCDFDQPVDSAAVLNLPEDVPPLRAFYLYLSNSCNLACRHCWIKPCYINGKPDPGDVIDVSSLMDAVQEARPLGLNNAKLTGGEPMLHPEFIEIVDRLTQEGLQLNMETNGTLLNKEIACHLKDNTHVSFISVSIDGADADTHDDFRGVAGAFQAVLHGLDCLVAAGYQNIQVITCVHRGNCHQVADIVRLAADHGAGSVKINPVNNSGRGAVMQQKGQLLDFKEQIELGRYVYEELRPNLNQKNISMALIYNIPLALMPISEIMRRNGNPGDCGVLGILGILGSGEIALCGIGRSIPELVYGRLGQDSIRDIWLNHPTILKLRRKLADADNYPGICAECLMAKRCRTGCVAQNFVNSGKLLWPDTLCIEADRCGEFPATRRRPAAIGFK